MALVHTEARDPARGSYCDPPPTNSKKVTCSTGGTRQAAGACGRGFRMTTSGCPTPPAVRRRPRRHRVLDEKVQFLDGRLVKPDEESYYDLPARSQESATVYEHCVRAIKNGLRFGEHGLPLMGSGDWNDGMNLVGEHGKGESVWLAFFLYDVLVQFEPVARQRQDDPFADLCAAESTKLRRTSSSTHGTGRGIGGPTSTAARRWAPPPARSARSIRSRKAGPSCLAPVSPLARNRLWMRSTAHLVKRDLGLIQLFDPPFDKSHQNPGYVKGYVPGVRGKRRPVHACRGLGGDGVCRRRRQCPGVGTVPANQPVSHGDSEQAIATYKVEPYVVAADVYTNPSTPAAAGGRGTPALRAGLYRLIMESLLGLHLEVDHLRIEPVFPRRMGRIRPAITDTARHSTTSTYGGWAAATPLPVWLSTASSSWASGSLCRTIARSTTQRWKSAVQ